MRFTSAVLFTAALTTLSVSAAPIPTPWDGGSAYSGIGGSAKGGSISTSPSNGGLSTLNLGSKNAGDGGNAGSGDAEGGRGAVQVKYGKNGEKIVTSSGGGSAYTGAAGNADGGDAIALPTSPYDAYGLSRGGLLSSGDALNLADKNAGDGGYAKSGDAFGGDGGNFLHARWDGGSAYSGIGGSAKGGSIAADSSKGGLSGLNLASGNAGDGGNAGSGDAEGGRGAVQVKTSKTGETIIESSGGGSAYTGAAGNADGGSVIATPSNPWSRPSSAGLLSSGDLLNTGGKNGGDGGYAKSGDAIGGDGANALLRHGRY